MRRVSLESFKAKISDFPWITASTLSFRRRCNSPEKYIPSFWNVNPAINSLISSSNAVRGSFGIISRGLMTSFHRKTFYFTFILFVFFSTFWQSPFCMAWQISYVALLFLLFAPFVILCMRPSVCIAGVFAVFAWDSQHNTDVFCQNAHARLVNVPWILFKPDRNRYISRQRIFSFSFFFIFS